MAMIHALPLTMPALGAAEDGTPDWLAERLRWFQDLRLGFFMHWGPYSQWGCIESWPLVEVDQWARPDDLPAWVERERDIERFKRDYYALNRTFNPTHFDPEGWADAAWAAGMRYVVFTTKHHDGFCMFDTKTTDYRITAPNCPFHLHPRSNVAREVFDAFRERGFAIGVYFSKSDWHTPYYWSPDAPARTRNPNYDTHAEPEKWEKFIRFVHAQVEELMTGYGPVDILWLDGGQVRPPDQDIRMAEMAAMARRHQPGLLVVDRTVGGEYENYRTPEQEVPYEPLDYAWESCLTMGDQWAFKPNDAYKSTRTLIHLLVDIAAKGGNLLLNVGPQPDGRLPPVALSRMQEMGDWMRVNGEAIYGTRPIPPYKEGQVALTAREGTVYATYLCAEGEERPPARVTLAGVCPAPGSEVQMLGVSRPLAWQPAGAGATIEIPEAVVTDPPCRHAYVLKMTV